MRRKIFLGTALVLMLALVGAAVADDLSMDATAVDQVGVSYSEEGTVLLLGIVNNDGVDLSINGGAYGASEPGAQAGLSGGQSEVEATGGYLHYTLYGLGGSYKITVGTINLFEEDTLWVKVSDGITNGTDALFAGGSDYATLGVSDGAYVGISMFADENFITGIDGENTWTGTDSYNGAPVTYKLTGDAGTDVVDVVYTILAEAI